MAPQHRAGTEPEAEQPQYAGQYLLEAELGSGGMGIVHLARSASGLRLAVKVVHADFAQDPEFRARFKQEVAAARQVSGAFTAPVVDADPEAERPWMATLFIPGPTLAEHVKRNGALPAPRLRRLMAGLAEALRDIHRVGVVHRDLKPSNVLLAENGPKVIDFGISRPADSELRTETGKLIGTPPFMAPEQFRRPREVGPAADVFALGSLVVHAATGSGPFTSDSPYLVAYQVVHDEPDLTGVPRELAGIVAHCLAKEPEDRPTPDELMTALRSVSASYDTQAFVPGQRTASTPDGRRDQDATRASRRPRAATGPPSEARAAAHEETSAEPVCEATPDEGGRDGDRDGDGAATPDRSADAGRGAGVVGGDDDDGDDDDDGVSGGVSGNSRAAGAGAHGSGASVPRGEHGSGTTSALRNATPHEAPTSDAAGGAAGTAAPRRRFARRLWIPVAVLAVCALAAGVHALLGPDAKGQRASSPGASGPAPSGPAPSGPAPSAPLPWSVTLDAPGAGATGLPRCTYRPEALYCARAGGLTAAVGPEDGRVLWSRTGMDTGAGTPDAPRPAGGLLHVVGADGTRLTALDPATGRPRWRHDLPTGAGPVTHAGGVVMATGADGKVTALDAATGEVAWRAAVPGHPSPSFQSYGDGLAYAVGPAGSDTRVTAVDPVTGTTRWQRELKGALSLVGARDGTLWFTSSTADSHTDAVVRYDVGNRTAERTALRFALPGAVAAVHGDTVHLLAGGGALAAVDTRAGKERWRLETSVSLGSAPVVADGRLYFTAADGRLLAVDAARGRLLGQTKARLAREQGTLAVDLPSPLVADGRVYAAAPDGSLFSVDARDPESW